MSDSRISLVPGEKKKNWKHFKRAVSNSPIKEMNRMKTLSHINWEKPLWGKGRPENQMKGPPG